MILREEDDGGRVMVMIGCFDHLLFRSTIPIGWRLRAFEWKPGLLRQCF